MALRFANLWHNTSGECFLSLINHSQLLVWTGKGELPIPQGKIDAIKRHFERKGTLDRIGFDCKVRATGTGDVDDDAQGGSGPLHRESDRHPWAQVIAACTCLCLVVYCGVRRHGKRICGASGPCGRCLGPRLCLYQTLPSVETTSDIVVGDVRGGSSGSDDCGLPMSCVASV